MLAEIQLKHYYLSQIQMDYNPESEEMEKNRVQFGHDIAYLDEDEVEVIIYCSINDECGSKLDVTLHGIFEVQIDLLDEDERHRLKTLCERNTLSILFPYLRSAISDISVKANIRPIILPTINILALIDSRKKAEEEFDEVEYQQLVTD